MYPSAAERQLQGFPPGTPGACQQRLKTAATNKGSNFVAEDSDPQCSGRTRYEHRSARLQMSKLHRTPEACQKVAGASKTPGSLIDGSLKRP